MTTAIVRTIKELRRTVGHWRRTHGRVAVVPTMGALHEGHLSLVRAAVSTAEWVIVTTFVNPRQFNNGEDLATYPRAERDDLARLEAVGTHLLFAPDVEEIYPPGFATTVEVSGLTQGLCGCHRPGHFEGVATIVAKLLLQTGADIAFFGEKDFQQLHIVRRLIRDLDIPVEIVGCPTVHESDGLAMSSRNMRLSKEEREVAKFLPMVLFEAADQMSRGELFRDVLLEAKRRLREAGFDKIDYLEVRSEADLALIDRLDGPGRLLVAASLGTNRLIDNVKVLHQGPHVHP